MAVEDWWDLPPARLVQKFFDSTCPVPEADRNAVREAFRLQHTNKSPEENPNLFRDFLRLTASQDARIRNAMARTVIKPKRSSLQSDSNTVPMTIAIRGSQQATTASLIQQLRKVIFRFETICGVSLSNCVSTNPKTAKAKIYIRQNSLVECSDSFDRLAEWIRNRALWLGERMLEEVAGAESWVLGDPTRRTLGDPEWFVGRIVCESGVALNYTTAELDAFHKNADGNLVEITRVQLSGLNAVENADVLFVGAVIAVRGIMKLSVAGSLLQVVEIVEGLPVIRRKTDANLWNELETHIGVDSAIQIVVANGPFSPEDRFDASRIDGLISACETQPPEVLLLLGPFVDGSNLVVQSCEPIFATGKEKIRLTVDDLYAMLLGRICNHPAFEHTLIMVMPSTRDIAKPTPFPQSEFRFPWLSSANVVCVKNPVQFNIAGVVTITATAENVIENLRTIGLPINNAVRSLFHQRSLLPALPLQDFPAGALSGAAVWNDEQESADILIAASEEAQVVTTRDDKVYISAGRMTTPTFARVFISKQHEKTEKNEVTKMPAIRVEIGKSA